MRSAQETLTNLEAMMNAGPTEESLALRAKIAELRESFLEAMRDDFNPDFRSNSFVAGGVVPIWKVMDNLLPSVYPFLSGLFPYSAIPFTFLLKSIF